jgi:hypothetical protein
VDHPPEKEKEKKDRGRRCVRDVLVYPEKIGEVVDEGEDENKKDRALLRADGGQNQYKDQ